MLNWFKKKKEKIQSEEKIEGQGLEEIERIIEEQKQEVQQEEQETKEKLNKEVKSKIQKEVEVQEMKLVETKQELEMKIEQQELIREELMQEGLIQEGITEEIEEVQQEEQPKKRVSFFEKLRVGLTKTRDEFSNKIDGILKSYKKIDEALFDDLEEVLVTADVGVNTTMKLIDSLKNRIKEEKITEPEEVKQLLKDEIKRLLISSNLDSKLNIEPSPAVILVVGVNGVGKTTTIGKLSHYYKNEGKKVLIAAGDTFRAAAIEQLEEWSNRAGVNIISHKEGADPAAVIYDGIQAAKARQSDVLICDTAGRLHNKANLMQELNKIFRVVDKEYSEATKEVLLVLDSTTGQNAVNQAKVFKEVANITGVALTKLDGTAKGGVIIALYSELNIPVKLVGVGEGIDDLQEFIVEDFVDAIFE